VSDPNSIVGTPQGDFLEGTLDADIIEGRDGQDYLYGYAGDDILIGGRGDDYLVGGAGSDIYRFDGGSGFDRDYIQNDGSVGDLDSIEFGPDVSTYGTQLVRQGTTLYVYYGNKSLEVSNFFEGDGAYIQEIRFHDGTVWNRAYIDEQVRIGNYFDQTIVGTDLDDVLDGADGYDDIYGGLGNDTLLGGYGDDRLYGEGGNDLLDGGDGSDLLEGGDGDDVLLARGSDQLNGQAGSDTYRFEVSGFGNVYLSDSTAVGSSELNVIEVGIELPSSGWRVGRDWDDLLLIYDNTNVVHITGFFTESTTEVSGIQEVRFADGTVWDRAGLIGLALMPTDADQQFVGTAGDDVIDGGGGADTVYGQEGDDLLQGGLGNDSLYGGQGQDLLLGEGGDDILQGDDGNDVLRGGEGADDLSGGMGDDVVEGGAGDDRISGGEGNDTYRFGRGDGRDSSLLWYYQGEDMLELGAGLGQDDIVLSRNGNQLLNVDLAGSDEGVTFYSYYNYNPLSGIRFADGTVWSLTDIRNHAYEFTLGTETGETMEGDYQRNLLRGLGGDDRLFGGEGDDRLEGGAGNDLLEGGTGDDVYAFMLGMGRDVIVNTDLPGDGLDHDRIEFGQGIEASGLIARSSGDDLVLSVDGTQDSVTLKEFFRKDTDGDHEIDEVRFFDGTFWTADDLHLAQQAGTEENQFIHGRTTDDVIDAGGGDDTVLGKGGNDVIDGGAGADLLKGGAGSDTYRFGPGWGDDTVDNTDPAALAQDQDRIAFAQGISADEITVYSRMDDLIIQHGAADRITLQNYFARVDGRLHEVAFADGTVWSEAELIARQLLGTPDDQILNGSERDDIVYALDGMDLLRGHGGNDRLMGGDGDDTLDGGKGDDVLDGGDGNDIYVFSRGSGCDRVISQDVDGAFWDVVQMGADIAPDDLVVSRVGHNAVFSVAGTQDRLTLVDFVPETEDGWPTAIEEIWFADGTIWDAYTVLGMLPPPMVGTALADTLNGTTGNDTLVGLAGNDHLNGNGGYDWLDGGEGNDELVITAGDGEAHGGAGDDTYYLDGNRQATLVEAADEGTDTVFTIADHVLAENFENLELGGSAVNGTGNALDNVIRGNDSANVLDGAGGNDRLEGLGGNDVLILSAGDGGEARGGAGNDEYRLGTNSQATLVEIAENGTDTVVAEFNYTLLEHFENLVLGGNADYEGVGNAAANLMLGNSGDNVLDGADGDDTLYGGSATNYGGNDVLRGGAGNDLLDADRQGGAWLGGNGKVHAVLEGGSGNDTLRAALHSGMGALANTLDGGLGNDILHGGNGDDLFVFRLGDGQDAIHTNGTNDADVLRLGTGIDAGDLVSTRDGDDLVIGITGTTDKLTVHDWYLAAEHVLTRIEFADGGPALDTAQIEMLGQAMAGFGATEAWSGWAGVATVNVAEHLLYHAP